jgi:tetratricopeptide (TPR) repeat protein
MELVKGVPITRYCDEHRLTPRERLGLFVQVCQGVQHAHQKGVIHRDLKPSNVLVAVYDGRPVPKIIDFGVAKATGRKLTERTLVTQFGSVIGTPEYMSPEQANPNPLDVDTRSDVYSLGVLLYELLTGTTPLRREGTRDVGLLDVLRMIREDEPTRPSTRLSTTEELPAIAANRGLEPKKLSGELRGDLDWIVMKCLEKDRARRYETASALARDVERYLRDEPVEASPPGAGYRLRKFARKHRKALGAAGAFAVLLTAATAVSTWQAVRATRAERAVGQERDRAVAEKERADEQAAVAEAVNRFLNYGLLIQAAPLAESDRDLTLRTVLDRASREIDGRFPSQPLVEARIRTTLAVAYQSLGEYAEAERHAVRARALHRDVLGPEHALTLGSVNNLAVVYTLRGRLDEARKLHEETLAIRRRLIGPEAPQTLASMNNLALILERQGKVGEARQLHEETLRVRRRTRGPEHSETLQSMMNLAVALRAEGELEAARQLFEETLTIDRRLHDEDHAARVSLMGNLADVLRLLGREDEARAMFEETLQLSRRIHGPAHPDTVLTVSRLAWFLATTTNPQLRDPPRALELAKEAVKHMPEDGYNWNALGAANYAAGDWQNAVTALEKSEELVPGKLVAANGFLLAMAHWQHGDPAGRGQAPGGGETPPPAGEEVRHQDEARKWYARAVEWMDRNEPTERDLLKLRAGAARLLGIPDAPAPPREDGR